MSSAGFDSGYDGAILIFYIYHLQIWKNSPT